MPSYDARIDLPPLKADVPLKVRFRVHPIMGPDEVTAELLDDPGALMVEDASVSTSALDEVVVTFVSVGEKWRGGQVRLRVRVVSAEEALDEAGIDGEGDGDEEFDGDESDKDFFQE